MSDYRYPERDESIYQSYDRVGCNTYDCDIDEIPITGITIEEYKDSNGVPLKRGWRIRDADLTRRICESNASRYSKKGEVALKAVIEQPE